MSYTGIVQKLLEYRYIKCINLNILHINPYVWSSGDPSPFSSLISSLAPSCLFVLEKEVTFRDPRILLPTEGKNLFAM